MNTNEQNDLSNILQKMMFLVETDKCHEVTPALGVKPEDCTYQKMKDAIRKLNDFINTKTDDQGAIGPKLELFRSWLFSRRSNHADIARKSSPINNVWTHLANELTGVLMNLDAFLVTGKPSPQRDWTYAPDSTSYDGTSTAKEDHELHIALQKGLDKPTDDEKRSIPELKDIPLFEKRDLFSPLSEAEKDHYLSPDKLPTMPPKLQPLSAPGRISNLERKVAELEKQRSHEAHATDSHVTWGDLRKLQVQLDDLGKATEERIHAAENLFITRTPSPQLTGYLQEKLATTERRIDELTHNLKATSAGITGLVKDTDDVDLQVTANTKKLTDLALNLHRTNERITAMIKDNDQKYQATCEMRETIQSHTQDIAGLSQRTRETVAMLGETNKLTRSLGAADTGHHRSLNLANRLIKNHADAIQSLQLEVKGLQSFLRTLEKRMRETKTSKPQNKAPKSIASKLKDEDVIEAAQRFNEEFRLLHHLPKTRQGKKSPRSKTSQKDRA